MGVISKAGRKRRKKESSSNKRLERDLRDCMRCRYFHGSDSRCIHSSCAKEDIKQEQEKSECADCPYRKGHGLCFPCMRKILGQKVGNSDVETDKSNF